MPPWKAQGAVTVTKPRLVLNWLAHRLGVTLGNCECLPSKAAMPDCQDDGSIGAVCSCRPRRQGALPKASVPDLTSR